MEIFGLTQVQILGGIGLSLTIFFVILFILAYQQDKKKKLVKETVMVLVGAEWVETATLLDWLAIRNIKVSPPFFHFFVRDLVNSKRVEMRTSNKTIDGIAVKTAWYRHAQQPEHPSLP